MDTSIVQKLKRLVIAIIVGLLSLGVFLSGMHNLALLHLATQLMILILIGGGLILAGYRGWLWSGQRTIISATILALLGQLIAPTLHLPSTPIARAASFVVNSTADAPDINIGDGICETATPGECTLRAAIQEANFDILADTITFAITGVITVTGNGDDTAATGDLDITGNLTITGLGETSTIIDGGANDRVFEIDPKNNGISVSLSNLTIRGGGNIDRGGGIFVESNGSLTLNQVVIRDNVVTNQGGGIYSRGALNGVGVTLSNNTAFDRGGGLFNRDGNITLSQTTISNNMASSSQGGGIYSRDAPLTLSQVNISNNRALDDGGGVYNRDGQLLLEDVIISNNVTSDQGGGIYNRGLLDGVNLTISQNEAFNDGGALFNRNNVILSQTIITGNKAISDDGGGIFHREGQITLNEVTISHNTSGSQGGGFYNRGPLNGSNIVINNNTALDDGGGIYNRDVQVVFDNVTINDNTSNDQGGGFYNRGPLNGSNIVINNNTALDDGGGIYNRDAQIVFDNATISGNTSDDQGGGIHNRGSVDGINLVISNNTAMNDGGAIYNRNSNARLDRTIISNNTSANRGGGIYNQDAQITLDKATLNDNTASNQGGVIYNRGLLTGLNVTISGNDDPNQGGIIRNRDNITLINTTIAFNGGERGVYNQDGSINLTNSLVAYNSGGNNCTGVINSNGGNMETGTTCGFGGIGDNADPNMSPILQDNGNGLPTHEIFAGGDGIDQGNDGPCPTSDENDSPRRDVAGIGVSTCDIGAYEFVPPTLSINNVSVIEGNNGPNSTAVTFKVTLSHPISENVTVDVSTSDGTATAGSDYTPINDNLTFTAEVLEHTIIVFVNGDTLDEANENFFINLTNPIWATIEGSTLQGEAIIIDDDLAPGVSISDMATLEGDIGITNAVFRVTLAYSSGQTISVDYATVDGSATAASGDYVAIPPTTLTFSPGITIQFIIVQINADTDLELDENFFVNLSNPNPIEFVIEDSQGEGIILNDDVGLAISDVTVQEGDIGLTEAIFQATLTDQDTLTVTVEYSTTNGTAIGGSDYLPLNGTLTFTPGVTAQTITVLIQGDQVDEPDETFFVNLVNEANVTILDNQGLGTIIDDDTAGLIITETNNRTRVIEGGPTDAYQVELTSEPTDPITIALTPDAQTTVTPAFLTFDATNWNTPHLVTVTAVDDLDIEGLHTSTINHTVTGADPNYNGLTIALIAEVIDNDDIGFEIGNLEILEGDIGLTNLVFTVTLSIPNPFLTATVGYSTSNGTALAGSDYIAVSGVLTFPPGTVVQTFNIPIQGDRVSEPDEIFFVDLDGANVALFDSQKQVTIINDDVAGLIITETEGRTRVIEGGSTDIYYAHLTSQPTGTVTVTLITDGQTTVSPTLLIFDPGNWSISQTVTVIAVDDTDREASHTSTISHVMASLDGMYDGLVIDFIVQVLDDEIKDADIAITGSAAPNPVGVRTPLTYTFTITNYGPWPATGIALTNVLSPSAIFATASTTCSGAGAVVCTLDTLDEGATQTVTIKVTPDVIGILTNTATIIAAEFDSNPANNLVTINTTVDPYFLRLPLISKPGAPDLVGSFTLTPNKLNFSDEEPVLITVIITNQGTAATFNSFWVDFFINPATPPTAANIIWHQNCGMKPCYGIAWPVTVPLNPGESIILTSTPDSYDPNQTIWPGSFATDTTDLYLYVDSWNPGVATGAVFERDETNNGYELHGLTVTGSPYDSADIDSTSEDIDLPDR